MLSNLGRVWSVFTPSEKRKALLILCLVILMAILEAAGVLSIMPFLAVIARPAVIQENALLHTFYQRLGFENSHAFTVSLGIASMVVVIASSAFKTLTLHLLHRFVHLARHSISTRLLLRYLQQPYEYFLSRNSAVLAKNVLSEVDQLAFDLVHPVAQLIAHGTVVLAMALLVFLYDPTTAVVLIAALSFLYGSIYFFVRSRLRKIGAERQIVNGMRHVAANEALSGIRDVKITASARAYQEQFAKASRKFSRYMAANDTLSQSPLYFVEAVGYGMLILVALFLMQRSSNVSEVLPALGLYGFAAYRMLPAAQVMYRGLAKLRVSSAALESIHHDLNLPARDGQSAGAQTLVPRRQLAFENVAYAYPSARDKPIFKSLNLVIPANASVGIVGPSGAGKSTLVDLLTGLLRPNSGCLKIDDLVLGDDNVHAWQRAIGYVPQHIFIADATVAENIAFGLRPDQMDSAQIERAARTAQIHDFIVGNLPDGYATRLGDRGIRLSGGQRQRIGIARALFSDPPILVMDEATSALDPETERQLNAAVGRLAQNKTIIIVSHRRSSIEDCDFIVHFETTGCGQNAVLERQ